MSEMPEDWPEEWPSEVRTIQCCDDPQLSSWHIGNDVYWIQCATCEAPHGYVSDYLLHLLDIRYIFTPLDPNWDKHQ